MKEKELLNTGIGLAIIALSVLSACTRPATLGPDSGLAYTTAIVHQTLNLDAGQEIEMAQGTEDGPTAKRTMERYRSSFEAPEKFRSTLTTPSIVSQGVVGSR
jgi:hypothetical protein